MLALILKFIFGAIAVIFSAILVRDTLKTDTKKESGSFVTSGIIGGVVYFFDTLGIGSFATSTLLLRAFKQVPDRLLPGTLNAMCAVPTLIESLIFISVIPVDLLTLISTVITSMIGAWLGAAYVAKLPEQKIRLAMTIALLITGTFMLANQLHLLPSATHDAIGLSGVKLVIAAISTAIIAALGNVGIGFYAPCLSILYLLGMSKSVFPIMMSCCALCSTVSGLKFIKEGAYNRKVTIAMAAIAIIGVVIAAKIVHDLSIEKLMWVVVVVVYYTAGSLFWTFYKNLKKL